VVEVKKARQWTRLQEHKQDDNGKESSRVLVFYEEELFAITVEGGPRK
jgi:hypothetical protein